MRKKLLSGLLALCLLLALAPATALTAAAEDDIIQSVGFAYRRPTITPANGENETTRWEAFYKLRNVFVVRFKAPVVDAEKENYSFAVAAGDGSDEAYTQIDKDKVYYTGTQPGITGSTGAYFEAPDGVLKADQDTYTVKITKGGKDYENSVKLLKVTLQAPDGKTLSADSFVADDQGKVQENGGTYSVFAEKGDTYLYLPELKNGTEGGGSSDEDQFVCWVDAEGKDAFSPTPIADSTTVKATFGVKPVSGFVVTDEVPDGVLPETNKTDFNTKVSYGATASAPINIYIVNIGNQDLGKINDSGFYVTYKSTDHFDLAFMDDSSGSKGVTKFTSGTDKYVIEAKDNAGMAPTAANASYLLLRCTPKANLNAGTYTDNLVINTPTRRITQVTLTVTVDSTAVTVEMGQIEKEYGQIVRIDENGQWRKSESDITSAPTINGGDNVKYSDLELALHSGGFNAKAEVKSEAYPYTVNSNNRNYNVTVTGGIVVKQATPDGTASVNATAVKVGDPLSKSTLSGAFVNPHNQEAVDGTLTWEDDTGTTVSDSESTDGVSKNWKFTPTDSTNYKEVTGQVNVKVLNKTPTTIHRNINTYNDIVTFDGNPHQLAAYVSYKDDDTESTTLADAAVKYEYRLHEGSNDHSGATGVWKSVDGGWPIEAGVWDIKVTYDGDDTYAPAEAIFHLTIEPKTLIASPTPNTKTYDGKTDATVSFGLSGQVAGYGTSVQGYTAHFTDANAGDNKTVDITAIQLSGTNYKLASETFHTRCSIQPAKITLKVNEGTTLSKNYGESFEFAKDSFTAEGLVNDESISDVNVEFSSAGTDVSAVAGSYPVTAAVSGNYTLSGSNTVGDLEVKKVELSETNKTDALQTAPTTTPGYKDGPKNYVTINDGVVVNPYNKELVVEGAWALTDATDGTFDEAGTATLNWEFTPKDENYTGKLTGEVAVTVLDTQPVPLSLKNGVPLTVTYDGQSHTLTADNFDTGEVQANITFSYPDNKVPQDVGTYTIIVTATPTGENTIGYAAASTQVNLTITAATISDPNWSFSGLEGTVLSDLTLPTEITGVNGKIAGTFNWETPSATITDENGTTHNWTFTHEDRNHLSPVSGSSVVTMADDPRTVSATVYNLPTGDYAVVDISKSGLKPGEKVLFYKDSACTDPVSNETEVPEGTTFTVDLDNDALAADGGTIYAKIVGKKTAMATITYLPELGFTLPFDMVLLHVGGTNANKPETVSVTPTDPSYKITDDAWTVAGDGVNLVEVKDNNDGSATFTALAAGTTPITVSITFQHPDPAKDGETIIVTKELPLNITSHYVVFTETVENGSATADPTEADEGAAITVTLTASSGYQASGLKAYKTGEDGKADETQPVTVSGSGNRYTFTMPASDVVLVPEFTTSTSGGGSTGGGGGGFGGGGGTRPSTGTVTVPTQPSNGSVTLSDTNARAGDTVTVTPDPTKGYWTGKVTVKDSKGNVIPVTENSDGTYSFTMPQDGAVTVEVTFDKVVAANLFSDLKADEWYAPYLDYTVAEHIFKGAGDGLFHPAGVTTRAEVMTILARLDGNDVDGGEPWYKKAVDWALRADISDGTDPTGNITREQVVTMMWRALGKEESGKDLDAYNDLASVHDWALQAFRWAVGLGIIDGKPGGLLDPQSTCTRAELAKMVTVMDNLE